MENIFNDWDNLILRENLYEASHISWHSKNKDFSIYLYDDRFYIFTKRHECIMTYKDCILNPKMNYHVINSTKIYLKCLNIHRIICEKLKDFKIKYSLYDK